MHGGVIEGWLRDLVEREFDEPFIWLLRGHGYYDIHFTHGQYEFGKDFVAKRSTADGVVQYAFQSKAGDIGGSEWAAIVGQIEELVTPALAHASYDRSLPRKHVLLTTGVVKGKAIHNISAYRERIKNRGEGDFEVWDREVLAEMLMGSREFPLRPSQGVSVLLAEIVTGSITDASVEHHTGSAIERPMSERMYWRILADTQISLRHLEHRPFVALSTLLALIRAATCAVADDIENSEQMLAAAITRYRSESLRILDPFLRCIDSPVVWTQLLRSGPGAMIVYSVACSRILETIGLCGLFAEAHGDHRKADEHALVLATIVNAHPGVSRPISDRYAVSIAPAVILLERRGHHVAALNLLKRTAIWLCDRLENDGIGLAGPYASPREETEHLLGGTLDFVSAPHRRVSLLALVLADLAYVFAPELYPDIVNDLAAVGAVPTGLLVPDSSDGLIIRVVTPGTKGLIGPNYPAEVTDQLLPHHKLQLGARVGESVGGVGVPLAVACLLRDRSFTDMYPRARAREAQATTGREAQATTGRKTQATADREAQATTGRKTQAASGREAQATTGRKTQAATGRKTQAATGRKTQATADREAQATTGRTGSGRARR